MREEASKKMKKENTIILYPHTLISTVIQTTEEKEKIE